MSGGLPAWLRSNRERLACAAAACLLAASLLSALHRWRPSGKPLVATAVLPALPSPPEAPLLDQPLSHYWHATGRDPFGIAPAAAAVAQPATAPAAPTVLVPPPADPDPSLYGGTALPVGVHQLVLAALPPRTPLKDDRPTTLVPRPHDLVQAPGDPQPIAGTVRRDKDGAVVVKDGKISFYFAKPKGVGHPRNPLVIADLLEYKLRAPTGALVVRERTAEAGNDPAALVALAQDCANGGLLAEAEDVLKAALRLQPRHRPAILKLAQLYAAQGKRDDELGVYRAALKVDTTFPEVRERLGQRCLEMGVLRLAGEHFARAFQATAGATVAQVAAGERPVPEAAAPRRLLRHTAEVQLFQGHVAEALVILERLAKADAAPAVRNALALGHLMAGRPALAVANLGPLATAPDPPACALNNLGAALYVSGDPAAALAKFQAARTAEPHHAAAARNAVLALAATGKLAEAEKLLASLPKPEAPSLHRHLVEGTLHERMGRMEPALVAYQAALAIEPASYHALCGLGRLHLASGKRADAARVFEQARLLQPQDDPGGADVRRSFAFKTAADGSLAEGWLVAGDAPPTATARADALHFGGRAAEAASVSVSRPAVVVLPAATGWVRRLARIDAALAVPYTNQAVVGLAVSDGKSTLQVGLRTTLKPKPSRRLVWRLVTGAGAMPWTELPGSVARDDFQLGLALTGPERLDVPLDGKTIARDITYSRSTTAPHSLSVGLFAAAEAEQECVCTIRQLELVWSKTSVLGQ